MLLCIMDYFKELELSYTTKELQLMEMEEELVIFAGAERMIYNPEYSVGVLTRYLDSNWHRIGLRLRDKIIKLFNSVLKTESESGCDVDQLKINYLKQFLEVHKNET